MVEEMMLLANVTVAEHVLSRFAGCTLLRRHEVPPPRQFEPLLKAASAAGFSIDIGSSKVCTTGSCDLFGHLMTLCGTCQRFQEMALSGQSSPEQNIWWEGLLLLACRAHLQVCACGLTQCTCVESRHEASLPCVAWRAFASNA